MKAKTEPLTEQEKNVLALLDGKECSAGDGMGEIMPSLAERGYLKVRHQPMLNLNATVGDPKAISVVKFYKTTAKGRKAIQ